MWFLQLPSLRILDVLVMDWRNQYLQTRHLHGCFPVIGTAVGVDQARPIPTLVVQAGLRIIVGHILAFLASHISYGAVVVGPIHLSGGDSAGSGLSLTLRPSPAESPMQPVQLLVTDEWNMQIDRLISLGIPQIPIARSRKRYLPWAGSTLHCIFTQRHGGFAFRVQSKCHGSEQQAPIWQAGAYPRVLGSYHDRAV